MSEPTEPAPFAAQIFVHGQPVCAYPLTRCEPCMFGQHPGGAHGWAGVEDIEHAKTTGQPDPSNQRCGCDCTDGPALDEPEPPDLDGLDEVTFSDLEPCKVCGEHGPCGYDAEGRALIHIDAFEDES